MEYLNLTKQQSSQQEQQDSYLLLSEQQNKYQSMGFQRKKEINQQNDKYETLDQKASLQNFEAYGQDLAPNNFDLNQGDPLQLLIYNNTLKQFEILPQALDELNKYEGHNVSLMSICGMYHSKKSTLINSIIGLNNYQGFDAMTTMGIWLWSQPLYNNQTQSYIFFMDSQGYSYNNPTQQDVFIQQMMISLSSMVIINTKGNINEDLIQKLSIYKDMHQIFMTQKIGQEFVPPCLWVFKDSHLNQIKQTGQHIDVKEYFEKILHEPQEDKQNIEIYQNIQFKILDLFKERECINVRENTNEQNDDDIILKDSVVSKEYAQDIAQIQNSIKQKCFQKEVFGSQLTIRMITTMVNLMVEDFNEGKNIVFKDLWNIMVENECIYAYNESIDYYNTMLKPYFSNDNYCKKHEDLYEKFKRFKLITLQRYNFLAILKDEFEHYNNYLLKLEEFIDRKEAQGYYINDQISLENCQNILSKYNSLMLRKAQQNIYNTDNIEQYNEDVNKLMTEYDKQSIGVQQSNLFFQQFQIINEQVLNAIYETSCKEINDELSTKQGKMEDILDHLTLENEGLEKENDKIQIEIEKLTNEIQNFTNKLEGIDHLNQALQDEQEKLSLLQKELDKQKKK